MKSKIPTVNDRKSMDEKSIMIETSLSEEFSPHKATTDDNYVLSTNNINNMNNEENKNKKEKKKQNNFIKTIKNLPYFLKNPVFCFSVLGLSTLCFVITVIQFWGSKYMEKVIMMEQSRVHFTFIIVCLTAPTLGVIIGGILTSCIGGYDKIAANYLCLIGALGATLLAIPLPFMNSLWGFTGFLYGVLVFGGIIFPSILGKFIYY